MELKNLFSPLLKRFANKGAFINNNTYPSNWRPFVDHKKVTIDFQMLALYNKVADFNSIIKYISQVCATLPLKHVRNDEEVEDSKVIELLQNPNEYEQGSIFMLNVYVNFLLYGNDYINKIKPVGFDYYSKLYLLSAPKISVITNHSINEYGKLKPNADPRTLEVLSYNQHLDTEYISYNKDEIIQIKDSGSEVKGVSRLLAAIDSAEILKGLNNTIDTTLNKGGALGFIKRRQRTDLPIQIDPDEKQAIQDNFYSYGVSDGKKPYFFTNQDLEYQRILAALNDYLPTEISDLQFKAICRVVGGLPDVLLKATDATFTNLDAAERIAMNNVILPLAKIVVEGLSTGLITEPNEKLIIDLDAIQVLEKEVSDDLWYSRYERGMIDKHTLLEELNLPIDGINNTTYEEENKQREIAGTENQQTQ